MVKYSYGAYNKSDETQQWIRVSQGCPNGCPYCYEPKEYELYDVPEIIRNDVKIMDMNLLCKPEAIDIINNFGDIKVNGKCVHYELICGIDYRFLTQELANALKAARFGKIRLAWDHAFFLQRKIGKAINMLKKAGYSKNEIMVFMICNWHIPQYECLMKLDLCKIWNVQVSDCYFDNQLPPKIEPLFWTAEMINEFRRKVRKHNQLVNFGIDPEYKEK